MAVLAVKDATAPVEQKLKLYQAVGSLLACTHDVPVILRRGTERHG
jgi:hypothetical protein